MNTLYYGEIAAIISGKLHKNPDHALRIAHALATGEKKDMIWSFCADAANVFDKIETAL